MVHMKSRAKEKKQRTWLAWLVGKSEMGFRPADLGFAVSQLLYSR